MGLAVSRVIEAVTGAAELSAVFVKTAVRVFFSSGEPRVMPVIV